MKTSMVRKSVGMLAAFAAVALIASCESEDTDSSITPARFYVDRDLVAYSDTDTFAWDTSNTSARLTYRIDDFRSGDTNIRILDGAGATVLTRTLMTGNDTIYLGSDSYELVTTTASGKAGRWSIELRYDNFTGKTEVTLE